MKILVVANPNSPATDYYRTTGVFARMADTYPEISLEVQYPQYLKWHHLFMCDIVVFQRPNGKDILEFIIEAKRMGKKIIVDIDDLLHNLTDANPAAKHFNDPYTRETMDKALGLCDLLFVSTPHLEDFYSKYTKAPIYVVPNCPDLQSTPFAEIEDMHTPMRVVWRGSTTHLSDLYSIANVWSDLCQSKDYSVMFIGVERFMLPWLKGDATFIPWQTLFGLFEGMAKSKADIGLFPLTNEPFNQSKSNIFALEMLCAGIVPIAPQVIQEFDHPGVLGYKNQNHLQILLMDLRSGKIDKRKVINEGREWITENRNLDKVNEIRVEALKHML